MKLLKLSLLSCSMIGIGSLSINVFADIKDGSTHTLVASHSNKCMDLRNPKTADSAPVVQMACKDDAFQKWKAIKVATDEYQIVSVGSGMCLDVSGASKLNGAPIKQSLCANGRMNQTWRLNEITSGTFEIISKNSNKCLDVKNASQWDDVQLIQWDCGRAPNQLWVAKPLLKPTTPIIINGKSDITISNVKISNPAGPCILIKGNSKNITIKDSELGPCKTNFQSPLPDLSHVGAGVFVIDSNFINVNNVNIHDTEDAGVTIFYGSNYNVSYNKVTKTAGHAIKSQGASNVIIQNNQINTVRSGIYAASGSNIKVLKNNITHVQGQPRANFVQFNQVNGAGNRIMCNIGLQDPYGTLNSLDSIEDDISLYRSNGLSGDPILVVGNKVKGGGPSRTGSGIMLGDSGGSNQIARDNVIVNSGNLGLGISGGKNIKGVYNKIYSPYLPITNNALAAWNYHTGETICDNVAVNYNQVNWTTKYGHETRVWSNNTCTNANLEGNKFNDTSIAESIFDSYTSGECR